MEQELKNRIQTIKEETAKQLNISIDDLSYITREFLDEFDKSVNTVNKNDGDPNGDTSTLDNWGVYGNSYWFEGNLCKWKQNAKGTPNYGCGTSETWQAGKEWAKYIIYKGKCSDGKNWYFIGNYQG